MITEDEIRQKIAETKAKVSQLDVAISKINGIKSKAKLVDTHTPTEGQPFTYIFLDPIDKQPGIKVSGETISILGTRANDDSFFSGRLQIDSDSSFVCHDLQGVPQLDWQNEEALPNDPVVGKYWGPLVLADLGSRYSRGFLAAGPLQRTPLFGSDFGFRFTDEGTGRRLFQSAVNSSVDNNFIPGRFLGTGVPYSPFGSNYTEQLPYKHVFAKNTAVRVDLKIYNSFEPNEELNTTIEANDLRIYICLMGYKVYGD